VRSAALSCGPELFAQALASVALEPAWIEAEEGAQWLSGGGHGPTDGARASASSLVEVPTGCHLPRHTDSAEETIVFTAGRALVSVGDQQSEVSAGAIVLVPAEVPHEVKNTGGEALRFAAVYADTSVVTTYEHDVQPEGSRQRRPVG
jgi:quercetin dioxygenase-like cupin family protein